MLKITEILADRNGSSRIIKVEGKLLGPWVAELNQACSVAANDGTAIQLDLSELTYLDQLGIQTIAALRRSGVRIVACSNIAAELLHEEGS
jgi:anti-anti-sigma regulatory factor